MTKKINSSCLILLAFLIFSSVGCKKLLNVTPENSLSGNNYWTNKNDFEQYTQGIYNTFRNATMQNIFFPATGDMRGAPVVKSPSIGGREYIGYLRTNNLLALTVNDPFTYFGFVGITDWTNFFNMVQSSNILIYQVEQLEPGIMSETEKKQYIAEAVFLRNLAYFFMVRLYGDVPYYTEAFHSEALPRTNMVVVLNNCIADLNRVKADLPWTYEDPSKVAIRAMRGGAIALLMHMNMWVAGFTTEDKNPFYEEVEKLGAEIMDENNGAYELLPLEDTKQIFKGRTKEGLFEIFQSFNYGERFHISSQFADYVLRYPNKVTPRSYIYYDEKFLKDKLYPEGVVDKRKDLWFDEHIYAKDGMMQLLKFVNIFQEEGEDANPDDNQVIFRYADVILLRAEALAELSRDDEAREIVNIVRRRADAQEFATGGKELKDDIYWERCRELMGEGLYFYDLVRTRKAIDSDYSFAPIGISAFNQGAWAWPIHENAMLNNPYMDLNNYWR